MRVPCTVYVQISAMKSCQESGSEAYLLRTSTGLAQLTNDLVPFCLCFDYRKAVARAKSSNSDLEKGIRSREENMEIGSTLYALDRLCKQPALQLALFAL